MDKGVVYICNQILFSCKKNEILPFVTTWMDLEHIMLSEIRERQILYEFTYIWNLKNKTDDTKQNK